MSSLLAWVCVKIRMISKPRSNSFIPQRDHQYACGSCTVGLLRDCAPLLSIELVAADLNLLLGQNSPSLISQLQRSLSYAPPYRVLDNRLRIMVPALRAAVITNVHGNGDMTEDVTFFGMLFEGDLLIGSNDSPGFAKRNNGLCLGTRTCGPPICHELNDSLAQLLPAQCERLHV